MKDEDAKKLVAAVEGIRGSAAFASGVLVLMAIFMCVHLGGCFAEPFRDKVENIERALRDEPRKDTDVTRRHEKKMAKLRREKEMAKPND